MRVESIIFILFSIFSLCQSLRGSFFTNTGSFGGHFRQSLFENDRFSLSGIGSINFDAIKPVGFEARKQHFSASAGLAFDNVRGFGLSLTNTHHPGRGNQLTGAGRLALLQTDNHIVSANAFVTNNMLNNPSVPEFQTVGGGVDYMFKDKMGASITASRTPFLQQTDYAVTGTLNLVREGRTSVDLDVGVCKSQSPFAKGDWEPSISLGIKTTF